MTHAESDYIKDIVKKNADEMMCSMLRECGWHEVVLKRMHKPEKQIIEQWANDNIKNGVWTHGPVWLFKDPKEANWFALRWS